MALLALLLLHLVPAPLHVASIACHTQAFALRTVAADFDPGARTELDDRWAALGLGKLRVVPASRARIVAVRNRALAPQAYRLTVADGRAVIESGDGSGAFYGAMTLAQLPRRDGNRWTVPCVRIEDRPALRWRILSDDVSRGPLPTMRYFEERIRTIAAFKMNGYSPYMEHVFVSPTDPLPAPLDGITPQQLAKLARYAARFHVALIPQQQTLAHMHQTLRLEQYAPLSPQPHGFLIDPNAPGATAYLARVIGQELQAVPHPPFFHIASDEAAVSPQTFVDHVSAMNRLIAPSGARIMLWDDAIQHDPQILPSLPRNAVIVAWHYGNEASFRPYIDRIAAGGLQQMVDPGDSNWNEIFPNVDAALRVERRFVDDGKDAGVLGLFESVWNDDGETLYEATWYPVLYAAASAWQTGDVRPQTFAADFPAAFFGVDDPGYSRDVAELARDLTMLEAAPYDQTDALFWTDPFDAAAQSRMARVDLQAVRRSAESVERHLYAADPPLHRNAAFVMFLAARRYDFLARKFQIGTEVQSMYADAVAHLGDDRAKVLRDLFWCRYWMWELRDGYEELAPLYARAWRYESRPDHLASNLERYHLAASQAIERADAFYRATYDGYVRNKTLPPLHDVLSAGRAQP
ncbi:MAG TPA: glycoside hydrolase family 20 zincin-like fold domain-containing protein [Candidatus Baltobacteraceae bacterium]|nr:glycoside hydrolase family 20 zincin-like fold domain-containing protein [Candidatus Baltobacteraceae bacterium]